MINVLKEGNKNIATCDFCESMLGYDLNDIHEREVPINQRAYYLQKYIICPKCGCKVIITNNERLIYEV